MNYKETIDYIYNLKGSEHKGKFNLSLKNIKLLLKKLDNPEKDLKIIHVAGTNGKGSVCAMLSSILKESGYKIGMYISPHLKEFRERFRINNKNIPEKEFVKHFKKIKPLIQNQTFFEVITAIAFLYFKEKKVDFLVCEVGLGGRLDATNVITPLASVITNIGLEHQEYLGETLEKIAYEKTGIIKNNIPLVTGAKGVALKVIKDIAKKKNAKIHIDGTPIKIKLKLKGEFQKINASIAKETIDVLNKYCNLQIKKSIIKKGLLKTDWHGRLEFISKNILVDCAHNLDAIRALKKEILKLKYKRLFLITGFLEDKDYKGILKQLVPLSERIILTKPQIPRALDPASIAKHIQENYKNNYIIMGDVKKALNYSKKIANNNDLILITGSIYIVGEAL